MLLRLTTLSNVLIIIVVAFSSAIAKSAEKRPNIVVILADDMGFGDVQALNPNSKIPTPNLNKLSADGMTFLDAHTPSSVCTPTRYGLLTGRYCWRTKLKKGVLNGYGEPLIQPNRETIASFLQKQNYNTGIVGKWHLGLGFAKAENYQPPKRNKKQKRRRTDEGKKFDFSKPVSDGPHTHGFDFSHVIPASLDFPPYVFIRNGKITKFPSLKQSAVPFPSFLRQGERSPDFIMENVLDDIARVSGEFIESHKKESKPFFLYVPLTGPHKPVLPHPRFRGKTALGPYGDFVHQVDETVGQILNSIDKAGIRDNTLVIYTSDNGSFMRRSEDPNFIDHVKDNKQQEYKSTNHTANGPFRGTKADIWEAGHHVPFFVRWPKVIKPESQSIKTVCLTDIFATAAEIAKAKVESGIAEDSFSFLHALIGDETKSERPPVIHHSSAGMFSIRDGKWKLVLGNGSGGRQKPKGKPFEKPYELYDLSQDIGEKNNVIENYPEVAKRLETECLKIRAE